MEETATEVVVKATETLIDSWNNLNINPLLLRGIYAYGFESPSPIQQQAIAPILQGRDIIAQAQSGTGKTATFVIGALNALDLNLNQTQVLILSPTKELATQTNAVICNIGSMMTGLRSQAIYGGAIPQSYNYIPHIICGCPGKICALLNSRKLHPEYIKLLIIDEADKMLSNDFKPEVSNIIRNLSANAQIAVFSATMPPEPLQIAERIMNNPVKIIVAPALLSLEGISQYYIPVYSDMDKQEKIKDLFESLTVSQCIIYCNSIERVNILYHYMVNNDFPVCSMHGGMAPESRNSIFNDFKSGKYRVLISSDITSRGIDVHQVSIVINFDIPNCIDNYLHRIGRSGRWGRKGCAINFMTKYDIGRLRDIEAHYACTIMEFTGKMNL